METRPKNEEARKVEKKKRFAIVKLEERIAPSHGAGGGHGTTGGASVLGNSRTG